MWFYNSICWVLLEMLNCVVDREVSVGEGPVIWIMMLVLSVLLVFAA